MYIPRITVDSFKSKIKGLDMYKNDPMDDLTLEAVTVIISEIMEAIKKESDFLEGVVREQKGIISQQEEEIKRVKKDRDFYKEIICYFMDR